VGYIIPKYAKLSEKVLEQILLKQDFDYILFDWKGLNSEDKKRYTEFFEKNNILWKKVKDLC
jgi:D-aminoacyl-tRNA deacylase